MRNFVVFLLLTAFSFVGYFSIDLKTQGQSVDFAAENQTMPVKPENQPDSSERFRRSANPIANRYIVV